MGRKWIALLLALALLTALAACGRKQAEEEVPEAQEQTGQTENSTAPEEETSGEAGTEPMPDSSEEEKAPARTAVVISPRRTSHNDDDGSLLVQENLDLVQVVLEDGAVADAINAVLQSVYDGRAATAASLLEQAKTDKASAEEYGGTFSGYAVTDQMETTRLDETVFSLVLTTVDATGGAHGATAGYALNFDLTTGKQLTLDDLTTDRASLEARLTDAITAELTANPDSYYPDAADLLDGLVTDGAWYFTDAGLTVLCDPYYLAPFAAGVLHFTVPYADLTDLLDEQWLPQTKEPVSGKLNILLADDPAAPASDLSILVDEGGTEMVLFADGPVYDVRLRGVSSSDGVTWYAGNEYLAMNYLMEGEGITVTAMLPDVMTNLMVTCTAADGSTAAYGVIQSGKDGSVLLLALDQVVY